MQKHILVLTLFLVQVNLSGQTENSSDPFIAIMKAEFEAFQKKDPSVWISYVHDDAVFAGTNNTYKTKEQIAEEMRNAPALFSDASETYENIFARTYGNTSVLSCFSSFSFKAPDGRTENIKFKFIRVHTRDNEGWKLVYHSAVPVE